MGVLFFFGIYYFMFILNFQVISLHTFIQPQYNFVYVNITGDSDSDSDSDSHSDSVNSTEQCPAIPPQLVGRLRVSQNQTTWGQMEAELARTNLSHGGQFSPPCQTQHRVAIIVPYRDRDTHLRIFLRHIHPILMRQNILYRILVISQDDNEVFNRAMLFNVGYSEAVKLSEWDCLVFHDVDLLPEDDRNLYTCPDQPRHMSVAVDKFQYKLPYKGLFGGVSAMSVRHFNLVNGFSNQYWGWGGEDDDMAKRLVSQKLQITRYKADIARYTMIKHQRENSNKPNPKRHKLLQISKTFQLTDGLVNLNYTLLNVTSYPLYTKISVSLPHLTYKNN